MHALIASSARMEATCGFSIPICKICIMHPAELLIFNGFLVVNQFANFSAQSAFH